MYKQSFQTDYDRYIPLDVVYGYQNKPMENYEILKGGDYGLESIAKVSNDVEFGESPIYEEGFGILENVFRGGRQSGQKNIRNDGKTGGEIQSSDKVGYTEATPGKLGLTDEIVNAYVFDISLL